MSNATTLLERMAPAPPFESDPTLSRAAKDVLGYGLLAELERQMTLRATLDELDVAPFTAESVERYKRAVLTEANREIRKGRRLGALPVIGALLALICFGPALLGWFVSWKIGLASVMGLVAGFTMLGTANGTTIKTDASWRVSPLIGYGSPVPRHVLQLAVRLKKQLPGVELTVHELVQSERVLDPFMVARLGETAYFIAVWDEPEFDAECL